MKRKYMAISSFFIAALLLGFFCYISLTYTGRVSGKVSEEDLTNTVIHDIPANTTPVEDKKKLPRFVLRFTEDGEVAVYKKDGETLYEKTGIRRENIPEDEVKKLEKGYAVKNKKELYSILENFSS